MKEKLTEIVSCRLTESEKTRFQKAAKKARKSATAVIRRLVNEWAEGGGK